MAKRKTLRERIDRFKDRRRKEDAVWLRDDVADKVIDEIDRLKAQHAADRSEARELIEALRKDLQSPPAVEPAAPGDAAALRDRVERQGKRIIDLEDEEAQLRKLVEEQRRAVRVWAKVIAKHENLIVGGGMPGKGVRRRIEALEAEVARLRERADVLERSRRTQRDDIDRMRLAALVNGTVAEQAKPEQAAAAAQTKLDKILVEQADKEASSDETT